MEKKRFAFKFCYSDLVGFYILVVTVAALNIQSSCSQKIEVIPVNDLSSSDNPWEIDSTSFGYGLRNLDMIWNISEAVEINITRFELNSEAGDFLIICEYPLPNDKRLVNGSAAEDIIHLLPVEKSLILSPQISQENLDNNDNSLKLTVRIGSPYGGFIYFHAVKPTTNHLSRDIFHNSSSYNSTDEYDYENSAETEGKTENHVNGNKTDVHSSNNNYQPGLQVDDFQGFNIQIKYLELNPTTKPTTTTERLTTPGPGVDIYLRKHVVGWTPGKFFAKLDKFKTIVAAMCNEYVLEKNITLSSSNNTTPYQVNSSDIRLDKETIFFCEQSLKYYDNCVKIQLAIPVRDDKRQYVMNSTTLEDMWETKANKFFQIFQNFTNGELQTLKDEPQEPKIITTWIWLAAVLTVILVFSTLLCFTFLGNIFQNRTIESNANAAISTINEEGQNNSVGSSFADHNNPIITRLIESIKKGQEDSENFVMLDREIAMRGGSLNTNPFAEDYRETTNGLRQKYQRKELKRNPMTFLNDGFIHDEPDEGFPNVNPRSYTQHHTFQAQVHSAQNVEDDEDSEEEVTEFWTNKNPNNVNI